MPSCKSLQCALSADSLGTAYLHLLYTRCHGFDPKTGGICAIIVGTERIPIYIYIYTYIHVCLYVCTYVCMDVCVYIYVYTYECKLKNLYAYMNTI